MTDKNIAAISALLLESFPGCRVISLEGGGVWRFRIQRDEQPVGWLRFTDEFLSGTQSSDVEEVCLRAIGLLRKVSYAPTFLISHPGHIVAIGSF